MPCCTYFQRSYPVTLKSIASFLALAFLSASASAIQCTAPRLPEALPSTMFSSFDLDISGPQASISKIEVGQTALNYGDTQEMWPAQATGTENGKGEFTKFEEITNATNWSVYLTPDGSQVKLRWNSTDGVFFYETYDCL